LKEFLPSGLKFEGLKADITYYAERIYQKLSKRLKSHYPDVILPREFGGGRASVVAWIWARSVVCPNPSCRAHTPLVNKFWLSTHTGNIAYAEPKYDRGTKRFSFVIKRAGEPREGSVNRSGARCLACDNPMTFTHIRSEGAAGRIEFDLMAMAVEGNRERLYLEPTEEHVKAAQSCIPAWEPDTELPTSALGFRVQNYGITKHRDLFTKRQIVMLSGLADEIGAIHNEIIHDAKGDVAYANLVHAFLGLSLSRVAQTNNTLVRWLIRSSGTSKGTPAFDRPIVSMTWEFSEGNPFGSSVGSWRAAVKNPITALNSIPATDVPGSAIQWNASEAGAAIPRSAISIDPPYFDAIGYADLSDFFYIWLRKAVGSVHQDIFGTMLVPKESDLTRDLGRREVSKKVASRQFLDRLQSAFSQIRSSASDDVPTTVYYAFKQSEASESSSDQDESVGAVTGWETLLEGLFRSGFQITGTWPLRTEAASRLRAIGSNALANSIVLVCRPRGSEAPAITRREFINQLSDTLPHALHDLQKGNIAPVDLAQAAIGPGMAVYTQYAKIIDAEGKALTIREALALINKTVDEVLTNQEGDFDADSRWALAWFEQLGFAEGEYGSAETLSKAKNTSLTGLAEAHVIVFKGGKVRLLRPSELPVDWDPTTEKRLTVWETVHQLIRLLEVDGEGAAAKIVAKNRSRAEVARELAYRLFTICERKKRPQEALSYNSLVQSWPEISRLARDTAAATSSEGSAQSEMFGRT
jgi:putative DNA methylase